MRNSSRRYELVVVHCDRNTIKKIINFGLDLLGYNCRSTIKIKKNDENLQQQKKKKKELWEQKLLQDLQLYVKVVSCGNKIAN